jgi:SAM-dependent methyltransferase
MYGADSYFGGQVSIKEKHQFLARARERMDLIEETCGQTGDLMDVGCSIGLFLHEASKRGWKTYGIDVSNRALLHARQTFGLDAIVGTLEHTSFEPRSFDVVTLFDSIEHMPNPTRALEKAWQVLKPSGVLVITTPDIDGFLPRWTYRVLCRPFGIWEHPTPPDHLYEFSVDTITKLVERAGFEVSRVRTESITLGYTVFELRSAMIEAVNRVLGRGVLTSPSNSSGSYTGSAFLQTQEQGPQFELLRRIIRTALLFVCYALVLPPHLFSKVIDQGNETLIVARKTT